MPKSGSTAEDEIRVRTRVGGLYSAAYFSVSCLLGHLRPRDMEIAARGQFSSEPSKRQSIRQPGHFPTAHQRESDCSLYLRVRVGHADLSRPPGTFEKGRRSSVDLNFYISSTTRSGHIPYHGAGKKQEGSSGAVSATPSPAVRSGVSKPPCSLREQADSSKINRLRLQP